MSSAWSRLLQVATQAMHGLRPPGGAAISSSAAEASPVLQSHADLAVSERLERSLLAMYAGDALAAPIHWYYSIDVMRKDLREAYGCNQLQDYRAVAPGLRHPDSWQYFKSFKPADAEINITHDKSHLWSEPGTFYHGFLQPGENTHTVSLARLLLNTIMVDGTYDYRDYLRRYQEFWRTPGRHNDTFVEGVHRHFFEKLAAGAEPHDCGMDEVEHAMPIALRIHLWRLTGPPPRPPPPHFLPRAAFQGTL